MGHTVLIIEDDEELRELMREALELNDYEVLAAAEGQEALAALAGRPPPCLVILDLVMPGMSGWEFFAKMGARPELAAVPVVVHTSAPSQAPAGVTRVLQKPLQLEQLLAVVREYCAA